MKLIGWKTGLEKAKLQDADAQCRRFQTPLHRELGGAGRAVRGAPFGFHGVSSHAALGSRGARGPRLERRRAAIR